MSKPHKDMLACVFCDYLRTSSSSAGACWVDLFRASTGLSVSKCRGLKCLPPPPQCDVGNFCQVIGISVLGFEVPPPIYGCLAILLGFEVPPPICRCLVILLGFEMPPSICRCLVILLGFKVSSPICGCWVVLGFWYFIPYVISCGDSRCPIH